jgi:D-sedoheptulose 7-phosphate isomerase
MGAMGFTEIFLAETQQICASLDTREIEKMVALLVETRESGGRLFILGVGGSAANASHAVNDFRKIAAIETYAPTDNVSELTARTNDEGWTSVFENWLRGSRLRPVDTILVFSVGGGDVARNVSPNLVAALDYARAVGARILGITGRDGGYTAKVASACVIVPTVHAGRVTPHAEAFQAVVWHLLVSHPALKVEQTKWESAVAASVARRAVFLDRDGVLNRAILREGKPYPPQTLADLEIMPGAAAALDLLRGQGFLLLVASNQPDVSRGAQEQSVVEQMNGVLRNELLLDDFFVCYHDDSDRCACRKPRPGLFTMAAGAHNVDLRASYAVGDRWRDVEAGANAGCRTVWIDAGYQERSPKVPPAARVASLSEAAAWIREDCERSRL